MGHENSTEMETINKVLIFSLQDVHLKVSLCNASDDRGIVVVTQSSTYEALFENTSKTVLVIYFPFIS